MPWTSTFRKGTDLPTWDWLSFFPAGSSFTGTANCYDGSRYMYWVVQYGSSTAAGTTQLWRYDTWDDGWQFLATLTSTFNGVDIEYDSARNLLWIVAGNATSTWQCFNLNLTSVNVVNQTIAPWTLTTMTTTLPSAANSGASLCFVNDADTTEPFDTGTLTTGNTTTNIFEPVANAAWNPGMVGLAVRMTSGSASGQRRIISAVSADGANITVSSAFGTAPASGDSFVIEYPQGTATAGSTTTLTDTNQNWTVNMYSNHDVLITAGTGVGQRRRIASNTATVLTLASATTGNTRTGAFTTAPDATSVYKIVPSSDFLYFTPAATGVGLHRIDLNTGLNASAWANLTSIPAAASAGTHIMWQRNIGPFNLVITRGASTSTIYRYSIGLNSYTTLTTYGLADTIGAGSAACILHGTFGSIIAIHVAGTTRIIGVKQTNGVVEPVGTLPYIAPSSAEGKRMRLIQSPDGVKWLYVLRAGGQEFYRLAIEHI